MAVLVVDAASHPLRVDGRGRWLQRSSDGRAVATVTAELPAPNDGGRGEPSPDLVGWRRRAGQVASGALIDSGRNVCGCSVQRSSGSGGRRALQAVPPPVRAGAADLDNGLSGGGAIAARSKKSRWLFTVRIERTPGCSDTGQGRPKTPPAGRGAKVVVAGAPPVSGDRGPSRPSLRFSRLADVVSHNHPGFEAGSLPAHKIKGWGRR